MFGTTRLCQGMIYFVHIQAIIPAKRIMSESTCTLLLQYETSLARHLGCQLVLYIRR